MLTPACPKSSTLGKMLAERQRLWMFFNLISSFAPELPDNAGRPRGKQASLF
jgi:hypothetical protein